MNENIAPNLPGAQIRELRTRKGLSLKELANRSGTSPSALHRYESGWGAFELKTLARLAAALDARLEVRLLPLPSEGEQVTSRQLVRRLRPLFWDLDLEDRHVAQNPDWVLRRVLQFGTWEDVHQARLYFGDEAVHRAATHRSMDARTRRFWQVVLKRAENR